MARELTSYDNNQDSPSFSDSDFDYPAVVNVFVDGPHDLSGVEKLTHAVFPYFVGSELQVDILDSGLSNQLLRVKCCQKEYDAIKFLVRVYGLATNSLIDRDLELACMIALCKLRGFPKVYCTFDNGICYSYANGSSTVSSDLFHSDYKWLICDEIAHFHSLPMYEVITRFGSRHIRSKGIQVNENPVAFRRLRQWIEKLPSHLTDAQQNSKYHSLFPTVNYLQREVEFLEHVLSNAQSPVVLCHNDLMPGNIILSEDKDKVTFIDYEFCGFNHAACDIGNHFCEYSGLDPFDHTKYPSLTFQREWISQYLKRCCHYRNQYRSSSDKTADSSDQSCLPNGDSAFPTSEDVGQWLKEVNYFALVADLTWAIWAAIRTLDDSQDFDFLSYAIIRMQEYERKKNMVTAEFPV